MRRPGKTTILIAASAVLALGVLVFFLGMLSSADGRREALESAHAEMLAMKDEYLSLSRRVQALERRKGLTKVQGVIQAVDTVFVPLGLKEKVKSVKPLGSEEAGEERAEVTVEEVTMNEMVNFLHSIETAPMLLIMRKIEIKTSFLNPDRLNIVMTLSLMMPQ